MNNFSYRNLKCLFKIQTKLNFDLKSFLHQNNKNFSSLNLKSIESSPISELQSEKKIFQPKFFSHPSDLSSPQDPLKEDDYFKVRNLFSVEDLFKNRVHLGHKCLVRCDHMKTFLFGSRLGVDIFDLDKTFLLLGDALNFASHISYRKGIILFLSRNKQTVLKVEKAAKESFQYSHCRQWRLGTFTNSSIQYGAVTRLPDLCIFLSTLDDAFREHLAIMETAKMNIPTIGIVDSNSDPRLITYPVPGNDDSPQAIDFYLDLFTRAIRRGEEERVKREKRMESVEKEERVERGEREERDKQEEEKNNKKNIGQENNKEKKNEEIRKINKINEEKER